MKNNSIQYTLDNSLCMGCGVCEDVCPIKVIKIQRINGENRPILDETACLKCGKCLKVCPGVGIALNNLSAKYFVEPSIRNDHYIGRYIATYTGYSLDQEIRRHGASGGMVTQFLIFLLEKGIIDGAVVTRFSKQDPLKPESFIAHSREEIISAKSSKYCPVALNKVGNEIVKHEGRYVIVGLPCHIQGFRKRAEIDKRFRERIVGYFSIYCSSNRTFNAQNFLMRQYKVDKKDVSYFAYRDNGCLGNMVIECVGKKNPMISIPFIHYYGALRSFFKPRRCLTCIDHYGELADVCFGDIHIDLYKNDKIGVSSWIVRNPYFGKLFRQAATEKFIFMEPVDPYMLNESQKDMLYPKQRKARALMTMDKFSRKSVAVYDKELEKPILKDYISEILCNSQRFIGRHSHLWFFIRYVFKKGNQKELENDRNLY